MIFKWSPAFLTLTICVFPGVLTSLIPDVVPKTFPLLPRSSPAFKLQDNIVGSKFFDHFQWDTFDDPTHGRVNYVDKSTAKERNLTFATANTFVMKADDTNIVRANARGRDSNRITSYAEYKDSVTVLDVKHVPWGCATWPAFWTVTPSNWPNGGEIDIIEGVNKNTENLASLHTTPGCTMDQDRAQTGMTVSTNCNAYANNNEGCGTSFRTPNSYGPDLNAVGGGWYVMKRTQSDGVYIWFFARNDPSVPTEIKGGNYVTPDDDWGVPDARFPSSDKCDFASHFNAHNIVFNLTFCGDWAGNTFSGGCGSSGSCQAFVDVDKNPQSFKDAYWEINALRIYVPSGGH